MIYLLECILKIYGFGWFNYFFMNWNRLDFFVAITGLVDMILINFIYNNFDISDDFSNILKILKLCRLLRLFKIIKLFKKL